jgi:hypothetical protein
MQTFKSFLVPVNLEFIDTIKVPRVNTSIALLTPNLGATRGWAMNATPWVLYYRERQALPTEQEAGWTLGSVWAGTKNVAPTGVLTQDRPARSG